jgi:Alginate export
MKKYRLKNWIQKAYSKLLIFLPFSVALGGEPEKAAKEPAKPVSYYQAPQSYSTTRDPDVPKYARSGDKLGFEAFEDATWFDFGIDYRMRGEYRDDDIRRPIAGLDQPLLHRTRAYFGIHDILDPFRFAIEMQDSRRYNGNFPLDNRDVNEFELIRLQAEFYFDDLLDKDPQGNKRPVSLRYGIQNFEFLDRRLLGNNQWRNTANTFLGFRGAIGQDANNWHLDLLAMQPLLRDKYRWDEPVEGQWIYGLIGHWREWSDIITLEPFYLALDQQETDTATDRTVHSPGLRAYGLFGDSGFDFDASVIHQFGNNGTRDVNAWGGTAEIGYRFDHLWKPRLSAFYGYASGDKDPTDDEDNRFERFYGFGRPWSANDYIVYENIEAPKLRLELTPTDKLRMDFGYSWFALASARDRFNNATGQARDRTGASGDEIGHEFDMRARWQITKKVELIPGYAYFAPGDFTENAIRPGDNNFAYLELNVIFF